MATWPTYAYLAFDDFAEQPQTVTLRSEMESGPPKQARILSRAMVTRPATVILKSNADYLAFRTWFRDAINRGVDWFDWIDPVDGQMKQARIVNGFLQNASPQSPDLSWWHVKLQLESWE